MLSDTARKLLMIMTQSANHHAHMLSLPELERLSGRLPVPIKAALSELVEENYIEWNPNTPTETAIIIEGWERPDPRFKGMSQHHRRYSGEWMAAISITGLSTRRAMNG